MLSLLILLASVLFFSRPRSEGWPHHGRTFSIYPDILTDSSTESSVHVLMLSIQAVRGLPRLRLCSLHYLFLQATPLFPHGDVTIVGR